MMIPLWAILALVAQDDGDLGRTYANPDHEFSFRPPADWSAKTAHPPGVVEFVSPDVPPQASLVVIHFPCKNATPLAHFKKELDEYMKSKYPGASPLVDRQGTVGGQSALQVAVKTKDRAGQEIVVYRIVVHRSNLDYYIFDAQCRADGSARWLALLDKSVATFRIVPFEATVEERAAAARAVQVLRDGAMTRKELEGETWQGVFIERRKVGHQRQKLAAATVEGSPGWSCESDTVLDFKEGGQDRTVVRGSFTADGRYQKIDSEETIVSEKKEELKYRYSAVLRAGRVSVRRHMRGTDEETNFTVPDGTLLTEVADVFRRAVALRSKETYLIPTLHPFEGKTGIEWIEVAGKENVSSRSNETREVLIVFSTADRRRMLHYWYELNGALYVIRGPKQVFVILGLPRDEATKP
ncbi:MAG: hypothetical protein HYY17_11310 [Planctomycetes bacterium]|nr:hypothetical protein [Planctomycetota bacterium]